MEGLKDQWEWLDHLDKELGSDNVVREYFEWVDEQQRYQSPDQSVNRSLVTIWGHLQNINWKRDNKALRSFNTMLGHTRLNSTEYLLPLSWTLGNFNLWLLVDGQLFTPPEVDTDTCEAYGVDVVNPGFVLGMRYSNPDHNDERDLFFAPLGRTVFSEMTSANPRFDTGFVLLVEILDNGETGKLIVISNPEDNERPPPSTDQEQRWMAFGKPLLKFTVAKSLPPKFTWGNAKQPQDLYENLEVESVSKPEIVATGSMIRKRETESEPALPVALHPRNEVPQQDV